MSDEPNVQPPGAEHETVSVGGAEQPASLSGVSTEHASGQRVGRYRLGAKLGRGGMGVVYQAWDEHLERSVALKMLRSDWVADASARLRMLREARAASQLHHPNIVQLYDCLEEGALVYLTMRLIQGPSLGQLIREGGAMVPERAASVAAELARALAHAHHRGVVHRDIKPANVLMEGERPVLTDFGLARALEGESSDLTVESQILGTPSYLAPELIRLGPKAAGPLTDQYALGVVLYEMLTGRSRVRGSSPQEILAAVLSGTFAPLPPEVPVALAWICLRATAARPEDRFFDMAEMAERLERFLRGDPVYSPTQRLAELARTARRSARLPALAVLGVGLLYGLQQGGGALWQAREERARDARAERRRLAMEASVDSLILQGRGEEATEIFKSYADLPENQETAALARAWLSEARRLAGLSDRDAAEQALNVAYGVAPTTSLQVEALVSLAHSFRERHAWDRLASLLAVLDRKEGVPEADRRGFERDLAATRADIDQADAFNDDPDLRPLLATLHQVTPTPYEVYRAWRWDEDGDGRAELALLDPALRTLTVLDTRSPGLSPRARYALPEHARGVLTVARGADARPGGQPLEIQAADTCTLVSAEQGRLVEHQRWPCKLAHAAVLDDLDGDGVEELYVADDRRLLVGPSDGSGALIPARTSLNHANSEVRDLMTLDVDGDGRAELLAVSSIWGAYDLRVLRPRGGSLSLVARAQLGDLIDMAAVRVGGQPQIAVYQDHDHRALLNRQIFGDAEPQGEAWGVHLLAWADGKLHLRGLVPWPTPSSRPLPPALARDGWEDDSFIAGDLDGDGDDELALTVEGAWTYLYRRAESGRWVGLALDGYRPLDFLDLDGDGDDELVIRDVVGGRLWVLGAGTGRLPVLRREVVQPRPPPEGLDRDLTASWERAEDLVAMGMTEAAVRRFRSMAELSAGTPGRGRALLRTAGILAEQDHSAAIELYMLAADEPREAADAVEAAFWLYDADWRIDEALEVGNRRMALPDPPARLEERVQALSARVESEQHRYDFTRELDEGWVVDLPYGLRTGASGLRVTGTGLYRLAHLPLRYAGGPAGLEVVFQTQRQDWSGALIIGIADQSGVILSGLRAATTGGGGVYRPTAQCLGVVGNASVGDRPPGPLALSWQLDPADGVVTCAGHDPDGGELGRIVDRETTVRIPEAAWLVIGVDGEAAVTDVEIRSITLKGFTPTPVQQEGASLVNGLLARGLAERALAAERDAPASLARVIALQMLGRTQEMEAALRLALRRDPTLGGARSRLLLLMPAAFARPLQNSLGEDYFSAFEEAYSLIGAVHPEQEPTLVALTTRVSELERARPSWPVASLLTQRAAARRRLGQLTEAEQDILRAIAMARDLRTPDEDALLAKALREQAVILLARGDRDGAMEALVQGLGAAPAPEVMADVLANRADLAELRTHPRWPEIERARASSLARDP